MKIDAKQIVVCYMIDVDKFEMSLEAYKRLSTRLKNMLTEKSENCEVEIKGLKELVCSENSMFEKVENNICLKKGFSRRDLYNELDLPYEILKLITNSKDNQVEDNCDYSLLL